MTVKLRLLLIRKFAAGSIFTLLIAASPISAQIVINEIIQNPAAVSDTNGEWFELHNTGLVSVDIDGYTIQDNGTDSHVINNGGPLNIAAGGFLVLGRNADFSVNGGVTVDYQYSNIFLGNSDDELILLDTGLGEVDRVEWNNGATFPDPTGASMALSDPGLDNNDGANWCTATTPFGDGDLGTPGAANDCAGVGSGGNLVINEIDYDQPGSDTAEFIEIFNSDTVDVSLAGFSLELVNGTGGGAAVYQTIALPAVTISPGDFYVVCSDSATVGGCDFAAISSVQNGAPDAVALIFDGGIVDTVSYEGDTGAPYTEGSGSGLEDPGSGGVGGGNDNKSISRLPDGVDTDQNNVDLSTRCATPGAANSAATEDCPSIAPATLVINEIDYDQPGGDTAEFVELLNNGLGSVDLDGITLELVNGTGGGASVYQAIALPAVTLAGGDYYVVCADAATTANCDLDAINSIQNGAPDAVALVQNGSVIDTVSYEGDTGAPYTEGSGSGLVDSGSSGQDFRGIGRFPDGTDSNANNVDFANACITPGGPNTSLTTGCTATGPRLEIHDIQGSGAASPYDGQTIRTDDNIVTAVGTNQFAMQTPASRTDADVDTSQGIIVFTGGAPTVAVGDSVNVTGTVIEFFDLTEFAFGSTVEVVSAGNPLPAAVTFDAAVPSPDPEAPSCAIEFECYEGMLVSIADGTVTEANQRFSTDTIAEVHITAAPARTFREPGVEYPGLGTPPIPTWDGNPEVFELDPDKLGLANQTIPAGSSFSATGVIGFEFGGYELWPTSLSVTPTTLPVAVSPRESGEFTVGTLNLFRLFDDIDDPADGDGRDDTVVSTAEYERRLAKFSAHIRDVLRSPDILAVQEVESLKVLGDLAAQIEDDDPMVVYVAHLIEGNDLGTIDVGFLTRERIQVDAVTQVDPDATFVNPITLENDILHDRPPLLMEGSCVLEYGNFPIAVMAVHNRSLGGIDGDEGERVRVKRLLQAESIAAKVQDLQSADPDVRLVVTGDFNAFEFTDGYADVLSVIAGNFDPSMSSVCSEATCSGDIVEPNLDLAMPDNERYSFIFRGNAQSLDHALTSTMLADELTGAEYGRGNADAAVDLINDDGSVEPANLPLRASDHDGLVVYINKDEDDDGVPNNADVCPDTEIPEGVPTQRLGTNRFALTDGDGVFDTTAPRGNGPGRTYTLEDTAGCSCEQIIVEQGLGNGHTKFGCSISAMDDWVDIVTP